MDEFENDKMTGGDISSFALSAKNVRDSSREMTREIKEAVADEDITKEIMGELWDTAKNLITENKRVLEEASDAFIHSGEAEMGEIYNGASKAQNELLKTLAGVVAEKEKNKLNKELKEKDLDVKKEIADNRLITQQQPAGANVLVMSREQLFETLFDDAKVVEGEVVEERKPLLKTEKD